MTETLAQLNAKRWADCHVSADKGPAFASVARRLTSPDAKARYQAVEKATGVPWWFIAVVHEREANQKWGTQLGQGDPLNRRSIHKPAGRGPFQTWEEGAIDALVDCPPYAARNKDWSIGGALAMLEKYNGLGYYQRGMPSPYIWAGTNQYVSGKYVADGVYDPNHVDTQLGCAGLLKFMNVFGSTGASAGAATGVVVAGGAVIAATPSHYWPWVIGGTIILAVVSFLAFEVYRYVKENK